MNPHPVPGGGWGIALIGVLLKPGMGRDRDGTGRPISLLKYGTKLQMHTLISVDKHLKCGSRPLRMVLEAKYCTFTSSKQTMLPIEDGDVA